MTLAQVRRIALALPEATEQPHFHLTSFRVGGKIFATASPDSDYLHVFVDEPVRGRFLAEGPDFLEPLPWGRKIVGLRVILAAAQREVVEAMLREAWRARAPKRLGAKHPEPGGDAAA